MESRPSKKSPESQFRAGSEGSRIETENPVKYPNVGDLAENSPSVTDHLFESNAVIDNRPHVDSPEMVRRENARARDRRTGFKITENVIYPSS